MTPERTSRGNDVVVGVDRYRGGWIAAILHSAEHHIAFRTVATFPDLAAAFADPAIIGVDVPIGLVTSPPGNASAIHVPPPCSRRRIDGFLSA